MKEKYEVIWYDMDSEKARDTVMASNEQEAITIATKKRNGKKPAQLASAVKVS